MYNGQNTQLLAVKIKEILHVAI